MKSLSQDERSGADFWAEQRSLAKPSPCTGRSTPPGWIAACRDAQKRLGQVDVRRRTEPDYKAGWNSYITDGTAPNPAPQDTANSDRFTAPLNRPATTSPSDLGPQDFTALQTAFNRDPDQFGKDIVGKRVFRATGVYVGLERTKVPSGDTLWMASVITGTMKDLQVVCFRQRFDEELAAIPVGASVSISGSVVMPLETSLILSKDCTVNFR